MVICKIDVFTNDYENRKGCLIVIQSSYLWNCFCLEVAILNLAGIFTSLCNDLLYMIISNKLESHAKRDVSDISNIPKRKCGNVAFYSIGHFRVVFCLCFKTSPVAKMSLICMKMSLHENDTRHKTKDNRHYTQDIRKRTTDTYTTNKTKDNIHYTQEIRQRTTNTSTRNKTIDSRH